MLSSPQQLPEIPDTTQGLAASASPAPTVSLNEGTPTVANIDGDLKVKTPIVGARVEAAAAERVDRLIAKEAQPHRRCIR